MLRQTGSAVQQHLIGLFSTKAAGRNRCFEWGGLGLLYLGGAALWFVFLHRGVLPFNFQDWYAVAGPRLAFLKDALMHGVLPLHISDATSLGGVTDRYLSIPDTYLAPQAILLLFLDIGKFVLVNQILMYTLGFAGLLWARRKYELSLFAFTVLFLLFNFNGHILSHTSIGHISWGGYFLFPWFAMLVLCMLDGDHSWGWVAKMSLLMLLIWLNGSFHQYVWLLLFLLLLAAASWKNALPALKAIFFTLVLGLVRILPTALVSSSLSQAYAFYGGYPSVLQLVDALVIARPPFHDAYGPIPTPLLWWELSLFVGVIGFVFLMVFGVLRWALHRETGADHHALAVPMLGLTLFSIGNIYLAIRFLQIPLFDGERVSARMISVPFVFLLLIAVIEMQRWLNSRRIIPIFALIGGILAAAGGFELWRNFSMWRVDVAAGAFSRHGFVPQLWFAVDHADPAYIQALLWGALGSAAGLLVLAAFAWLEKRGALVDFAQWAVGGGSGKAVPQGRQRLPIWLVNVLVPMAGSSLPPK